MGDEEIIESFACFGSICTVAIVGDGQDRSAREALKLVKSTLLGWHRRFSRFISDSELSTLNEDPRREVPVSSVMAQFASAVQMAGSLTEGLVDATLVEQIEIAGYTGDLAHRLPLSCALGLAPKRWPAAPNAEARWRSIEVDLRGPTISRPRGVKLDSGGLAKGLFADILAQSLATHPSFAINCAGDLTIGGAGGFARPVNVESPFDERTLHTFEQQSTGVATSGIGRRAWLDADGHPAHHLLDPCTGKPAFTGIVQVTALAPNALLAEIFAKAALLAGPRAARGWLPHGGVIVLDDGSHHVIEPPTVVTLTERCSDAGRSRRLPANSQHAPNEV